MTGIASTGRVYRCGVCGAEITILVSTHGEFVPRCCNTDMHVQWERVTFYQCSVCGSQIVVLTVPVDVALDDIHGNLRSLGAAFVGWGGIRRAWRTGTAADGSRRIRTDPTRGCRSRVVNQPDAGTGTAANGSYLAGTGTAASGSYRARTYTVRGCGARTGDDRNNRGR